MMGDNLCIKTGNLSDLETDSLHPAVQLQSQSDPDARQKEINRVFTKVAGYYDFMNDAMSLGLHRIYKRILLSSAELVGGMRVLDLAAGTGDLSHLLCSRFADKLSLCLCDPNSEMLDVAKGRLGTSDHLSYVGCCAEDLSSVFAKESFDRVLISYGLRNFAERPLALQEIGRVLVPGGRLCVLEMAKPTGRSGMWIEKALKSVLPTLGECLVDDSDSYKYLADSVSRFVSPWELAQQLRACNWCERVAWQSLAAGSMAVHIATKR